MARKRSSKQLRDRMERRQQEAIKVALQQGKPRSMHMKSQAALIDRYLSGR